MRVLTLVFAFLLAAAAPARADFYWDGAHGHFDGERDAASNPMVARAVAAGQGWWSKQGVYVCGPEQGLNVLMAPDLTTDAPADGRAVGCDIWILQADVEDANSLNWAPVWGLCDIVWHELAHTPPASMTHEEMAAYGSAKRAACRRFADRVVADARTARRLRSRTSP